MHHAVHIMDAPDNLSTSHLIAVTFEVVRTTIV